MVREEDDTEEALKPLGHYIREGLKQLYQNQQLCDATIVAEGKRFPCHRMLLAAVNPYFRAMFVNAFKESQDGEILLQDMAPSTVQTMLHYLYTEEALVTAETAPAVFTAASRLQILPLMEICSSFLLEHVSLKNCLVVYELGYAHGDQALLQAAMRHISLNFRHLSLDKSFLHLKPSTLISIISSDSLVVSSEMVVYRAVQHWMKFQTSSRCPFLSKVMRHIRLPLLTQEELREVQLELERYGDLRLRWKRLNRQERLQECGGLRQGMYNQRIVCVDLFNMEGPELKTKDFQVGCFDPQREKWEKLPPLKCLYCARCLAVADKLYVTGGVHTGASYSNTLHEYSSVRGRWTQLPSMSVPRASHGFLSCNQKLYAAGGWCRYEGYLDSAECFDLLERTWTPISRLPYRLSHFAATVLKNKLYLIGGVTDTWSSWNVSRKVLIYKVSSDVWTQVLLEAECYWSGAVSMNNGIYVIGGYVRSRVRHHNERWPDSGNLHCSRKCFFLCEDGSVDKNVVIPKLPVEIAGAGVVRWKKRIYVLGGENTYLYNNHDGGNGEEYYNTIYYWEPGDHRWTQCPERIAFSNWGISGFGCATLKIPKKTILSLFRKTSVALTAVELAES
ncbi:kelch repeat and BTB domain-containing protein 8-like [Carettochelys insculpta]|uniref:kelch repeat and BTB domain-containing protein 8-like n=1 Tax=Carettochelys insculpta TaxID=44489 RepID=UPI003EBB2247